MNFTKLWSFRGDWTRGFTVINSETVVLLTFDSIDENGKMKYFDTLKLKYVDTILNQKSLSEILNSLKILCLR